MRRGVVLVVAGLALAGCVRGGSSSSSSVIVAPSIAPQSAALPAEGTLVVRARGPRFRIYEEPGQGAILTHKLVATNDWAQPLWLPAIDGFEDAAGATWYEVRLPIRPNGTTGWVPAAGVAGRDVGERIEVDLSEHRLWRFAGGRPVSSFEVGVGTPASPTAPGHFFVWARVPSDPSGPYGVLALGLSGFSDVITDWVGGGRLAIHGTASSSDRGADVSHGCVRVFNPQMITLADVSLGTPVWIHR